MSSLKSWGIQMGKWITKKLSPDLCMIIKGQQVNKTDLAKSGTYYVLNGGIEPSGYYEKCNTAADTISISEGGNSCGYVKYNITSFWSGGHNYTLKNLSPKIQLGYLYHYLKYREPYIMRLRVGSGLPNIQRKDLSNVGIVYPQQENEQNKIAEVLSTVDEVIEKTTAIIEKYKNIKRGLMQDLLNKGEEVDFFTIARHIRAKRKLTNNDICLNMDCIESGTGQISTIAEDNLTSDKTSFVKGDVLFGKLRPYLRKYLYCAFDGFCSSEILVFRAKESIRNQFLYYSVSSENFVNYNTTQTFGTRMPRTSWDIIKKYKVKLPKLEVQDEIIEKIEAIDTVLQSERNYLTKLQDIKKGLMHDLLTNKVSVEPLLKEEAL